VARDDEDHAEAVLRDKTSNLSILLLRRTTSSEPKGAHEPD